jgi:hypothetical protein
VVGLQKKQQVCLKNNYGTIKSYIRNLWRIPHKYLSRYFIFCICLYKWVLVILSIKEWLEKQAYIYTKVIPENAKAYIPRQKAVK